MASSTETITRFLDYVATGKQPERARVPYPECNNILASLRENTLFSYGRHFPLVTFFPRKRGGLFVMNGDRWPNRGWGTTSNHQSDVRRAVDRICREEEGFESILVPFSALRGAGIDLDSIRPIEVRDDTHSVTKYRSKFLADVPKWMRTKDERRDGTISLHDLTYHEGVRYNSWTHHFSQYRALPPSVRTNVSVPAGDTSWNDNYGNVYRVDEAYGRHVPYYSRDKVNREHVRLILESDPVKYSYHVSVPAIFPDDDGWYKWETPNHILGESLFTATANGSKARRFYLSGFDRNESPALYFLAMLASRYRPATVAEAFDCLMPAIVKQAIASGRDVKRQGDIFFIETTLTDSDIRNRCGNRRSRRSVAFNGAAPRKGEAGFVTVSKTRAAKLAKLKREMDSTHDALVAFVSATKAEYPNRSRAADYPESVIAEYNALQDASYAASRAFNKANPREDRPVSKARDIVKLYGTDHVPTEAAMTKSGAAYAKGIVYHERRDPDHARLRLNPDTWYLAVRNTVPRARGIRRNVRTVNS